MFPRRADPLHIPHAVRLLGEAHGLVLFHIQEGLKQLLGFGNIDAPVQFAVEIDRLVVNVEHRLADLVEVHVREGRVAAAVKLDRLVLQIIVHPGIQGLGIGALLEAVDHFRQSRFVVGQIGQQQLEHLLIMVRRPVGETFGKLLMQGPGPVDQIRNLFYFHALNLLKTVLLRRVSKPALLACGDWGSRRGPAPKTGPGLVARHRQRCPLQWIGQPGSGWQDRTRFLPGITQPTAFVKGPCDRREGLTSGRARARAGPRLRHHRQDAQHGGMRRS